MAGNSLHQGRAETAPWDSTECPSQGPAPLETTDDLHYWVAALVLSTLQTPHSSWQPHAEGVLCNSGATNLGLGSCPLPRTCSYKWQGELGPESGTGSLNCRGETGRWRQRWQQCASRGWRGACGRGILNCLQTATWQAPERSWGTWFLQRPTLDWSLKAPFPLGKQGPSDTSGRLLQV